MPLFYYLRVSVGRQDSPCSFRKAEGPEFEVLGWLNFGISSLLLLLLRGYKPKDLYSSNVSLFIGDLTMKLEAKTKMYAQYKIGQDDVERLEQEGLLQTEEATISEAYFGRHPPSPDPVTGEYPFGLNIQIDGSFGSAGVTYKNLEEMEGLMNGLNVQRTEEMAGKKVLAYISANRLIGLSAPQTD